MHKLLVLGLLLMLGGCSHVETLAVTEDVWVAYGSGSGRTVYHCIANNVKPLCFEADMVDKVRNKHFSRPVPSTKDATPIQAQ